MKHTRYLGRWIAAGVGALVLSGAGVAGATTPPTEPSADTAATADTSAETGDTSLGLTTEAMTGAGPSDCPPIAAATESTAPAGSEVAMDTAAPADATATTGGETMATTATSAGETMATTETMETTGSMAPMSGPFVQVAESEEYGQILVDAECRTLYVFSQDVDGEATCVDDCAANWPPLLVPDDAVPPLADELDPSLFSVVDHPDGAMLKVGDWPLYYFANDAAPGDVNGQGVGGVWWVVGPDGTPFEEAAETAGTEPADGSAAPAASAPAASMPTETAPMTTAG
jgi:predicted lipoprotein with Yx(FWY)xxD motif